MNWYSKGHSLSANPHDNTKGKYSIT